MLSESKSAIFPVTKPGTRVQRLSREPAPMRQPTSPINPSRHRWRDLSGFRQLRFAAASGDRNIRRRL